MLAATKTTTWEGQFPLTLQVPDCRPVADLVNWYKANQEFVEEKLLKVGAVFLKGANIHSVGEFSEVMKAICPEQSKFLDGNSQRSKHTSNVYNASEYDPSAKIYLHTEYSYSNLWPARLYFCCTQPAASGGETIIADCHQVLTSLSPALVEAFEKKGIKYIRNMHGGQGLGPSWQEAFETESKPDVEEYCERNGIECYWKDDNGLKVVQTRPALRRHPVTGQTLWFNQVDQFFPQLYGEDIYEALLFMHGNDKEELPMYATFGDGSEIKPEYMHEIIAALRKAEVNIPWGKGDLLILDNMLVLHGRQPFQGERSVLVSMS